MDQITIWLGAHPAADSLLLYVLFGVLALLFGRRSQIDAWVETQPRLAGALKILRGVGFDPWLPLQGLCLLVFGRLPKEGWIKPKLPLGVTPLLVLVIACGVTSSSLALYSCASTPVARAQVIEASKALAFNEAAVALALLDHDEAARLDAIEHPTAAQVAAAEKRVALLKTVRNDLQQVRDWIEGTSDADGPKLIHAAFENLNAVVILIEAEGGEVPPEVEQALMLGSKYL